METVQRLWVPESPVNQSVKLDCLKIAAASKGRPAQILKTAQQMYAWVVDGQKR